MADAQYLTYPQLNRWARLVVELFPEMCRRTRLPHLSLGKRAIYATRLRGGPGADRRAVLITGGVHARELMNPDAIVELLLDLVFAYRAGSSLTYGQRTWNATSIKLMVETLDIWFIPCVNPDGRVRVMDGDSLWRKNVRDNLGTDCDGVDLNRNFDIAWATLTATTSCSPCSYQYCGPEAASEPETKNVAEFCAVRRIDVALDVHSFKELVLYPWGHASTQTGDPTQTFATLPYGTCAYLPGGYEEYMPAADLLRFTTVSSRIVEAIAAVRGHRYTAEPIHLVYPGGASGTGTDYLYSRHRADPAQHKTYAFAFETGPDTTDYEEGFHPSNASTFAWIKAEAKAGMLALIEQSVCAIDFVGTTLSRRAADVDDIRALRDATLATTQAGRGWIDLVERIQWPILGAILEDAGLAKEAKTLFRRAAALVEDDSAQVTARDAKRAAAFFDRLASRLDSEQVRQDVAQISEQVSAAVGRTLPDIAATLMARPPRRPRRNAKSLT